MEVYSKDALAYMVETGREVQRARETPVVHTIGGREYLFFKGEYKRIDPLDPLPPDPFKAFSLDGLIDFIGANVDGMFSGESAKHTVRVGSVSHVEVLTPLRGYQNKRYIVAYCDALIPGIPFDKYMDAEAFQVMLQTRFEQSDARDTVLKLTGCIRDEQSMDTADDGFSQRVTVSKGVATAGNVTVRNPVPLVPLRTFHEVQQPESPFILRFSEGAKVALFEGDGGAWQLQAVKNIRDYLVASLAHCNVEVIA